MTLTFTFSSNLSQHVESIECNLGSKCVANLDFGRNVDDHDGPMADKSMHNMDKHTHVSRAIDEFARP